MLLIGRSGDDVWELHIAELADSQHWNVIGAPDDPKFPFCHVSSLRRSVRRSRADNINLHHYRTYDLNVDATRKCRINW